MREHDCLRFITDVPQHHWTLTDELGQEHRVAVRGRLECDNSAVLNQAMRAAAREHAGIIDVVEDPIVSSDVIGNPASLLFDIQGTIKAGSNTIKTLSWYENLGHAARLLDVVRLYNGIDGQREAA